MVKSKFIEDKYQSQLKNQSIFNEIMQEKMPLEAALIATNNSSLLRKRNKKELEEGNKHMLKLRERSLFDQALLYGDFEAINILVDAKSETLIPSDETSLKRYLLELFTQYGAINSFYSRGEGNSEDSEDISNTENKKIENNQELHTLNVEQTYHDKSVDNLIKIFEYLESNVTKGNQIWRNKNVMNTLFADAANGEALTVVEALLKLDLIDNVNIPDKSGKTALYYLLNKINTIQLDDTKRRIKLTNLIADLKKRGAQLSENDNKALANEELINKFIKALKENNNQVVETLLKENSTQLNLTTICDVMARIDIKLTDDVRYLIATTVHRSTSEYDNDKDFTSRLSTYSHRIGLSGDIKVGEKKWETEGSTHSLGRQMLCETLQNYLAQTSSHNEVFTSFYNALSFLVNVEKLESDIESMKSLSFNYYAKGNDMILSSGWTGHGVGIAVKYDKKSDKSYISISNRGRGGLNICLTTEAKEKSGNNIPDTGTIVYELQGQLNSSFFEKMNEYSDQIVFDTQKEFHDELNKQLKNATPIIALPARQQKHGTCGYVNQKRCIEGLLLIEAICNDKDINDKKILDEVYDQYKLFSVEDKAQAVSSLITYYETGRKNLNEIEIAGLNELIIKIIILHHSSKYNDIELNNARKLISLLPDEKKDQLLLFIPDLASLVVHAEQKDRVTLFSANRDRIRDIKIIGENQIILKHSELINNLLDYLNLKGIQSNEVNKIEVKESNLIIHIPNRNKKHEIIENIFGNKGLNANIDIMHDKQHEFIVNQLGDFSKKLENEKRQHEAAIAKYRKKRGGDCTII